MAGRPVGSATSPPLPPNPGGNGGGGIFTLEKGGAALDGSGKELWPVLGGGIEEATPGEHGDNGEVGLMHGPNQAAAKEGAGNDESTQRRVGASDPRKGKAAVPWSALFSTSASTYGDGFKLSYVKPELIDGVLAAKCPDVMVSKGLERWKNTLMGHFIGGRPSFTFARDVLLKQWRIAGHVDINLLESGIFVFRFNLEDDKVKVLEGGPWYVQKRPMILRPWSPDVCLEKVNLCYVPVWVSLPNLPFHFWSPEALSSIGSVIGKPIVTDKMTSSMERLSYARLCVEDFWACFDACKFGASIPNQKIPKSKQNDSRVISGDEAADSLRQNAKFVAQVYMEVDKFGDNLIKDPEKSLPSLLISINSLFSKLEASLRYSHEIFQGFSGSVDWNSSFPLLFDKLPEANLRSSQWTDGQIIDAVNLIHENLHKLDFFLSVLVPRYRKPRRITLYWFRYTCGAVGLMACSVWLLRHSSLMGSSDIDNWIHEARDSTVSFWNDHVEQPLLSIRDELFETFRRRHKGVMDIEEVQLTANSLHRMLLAFSEQIKSKKFPEDVSDQEMMEIVMGSYEKELMHPIQSLLGGELARALLIQIQKLKLDIETAMLELNQILKANEINFAILAALPAFFLSLILLMLLRAWFTKETGAEGRGRIARVQRRLLIVEVEKRVMQFQNCVDQGLEEDAHCMFGLVLYSLDCLHKAVERHAKATGEWLSLRQDITDLAKPDLQLAYKLAVTSRMERVYDCLLPSSKRR
ncbi:protein DGS1, mitochondrial-like [Telopea speciosissima]|uniref:protein DGS1, mitochondrial-like n=1 Tax=Telopea speciosissima TaxID=54955 RepID=UPI001CC3DBE5|nr:protein DGS1, mitochondrial-like [Telopea speciosissima]